MALPRVVFTFDEHKEAATEAWGVMNPHGLMGTYYVTPSLVDTANGPAKSSLLAMKQVGWGIELYSGSYSPSAGVYWNMVQLEASNRITANDYLIGLKNSMQTLGLPVKSIAPNQRAWNLKLRNMMVNVFDAVRVVDNSAAYQSVPVADPLWVKDGGTASLSSTDTVASLSTQVDSLIAAGNDKLLVFVIHRVSDDGLQPTLTVNKSTVFAGLCSKVGAEIAAGNLAPAIPFERAIA